MGDAHPQAQPQGRVIAAAMLLAAAPALLLAAAPARADDYPSRLVTLVVPYPPGGGVDAIGRIVAAKLTAALGQQVVVENRGGAAGVIGMRAVAKAPPDGYTLVVTTTGMSLPSNLGYDLGKDFSP